MFDTDFLTWLGLVIMVIGVFIMITGMISENIKMVLSGMAVLILVAAAAICALYKLDALYLSVRNAVAAVPTWVWVVVGVTTYFTLNHIYASWLDYAHHHPSSLAQKILEPWPLGTVLTDQDVTQHAFPYLFGSLIFVIWWIVAIISYAAWLILGGGIAKLLHLVPRE